jgi:hypothetical protein
MGKVKQRRESASAVVFIPVAALLVMFLFILGVSAFLEVMRIEVTGVSVYSVDEVIAASMLRSGDNLLLANVSDASDRILAALPYVESVEIRRVLPDMIYIDVKESVALATVVYRDGVLIIDASGRILARVETAPQGLIEIRGVEPIDVEAGRRIRVASDSDTQIRHMADVLSAIEGVGVQDNVPYLDIASIANITMGYTDRYTIVLGGQSNIHHRLTRLLEVIADLEDRLSPNATGTIRSGPDGEWIWNQDR